MINTTHFRISHTDVILQDYEDGKGKIIISNDDFGYNLSYYWGSMGKGCNLSQFILNVNDDYLIRKLGQKHSEGQLNIQKTMANVRKYIIEETDWKFYYSPSDDKNLRNELNKIQRYSVDAREFVDRMQRLEGCLFYTGTNDDYNRGKEAFEGMIWSISTEPWYFIVNKEPRVNTWLKGFLNELRKVLTKGDSK